MKFPKSVHAEGWLDHIEKTTPEHMPEALSGSAPRVTRKPLASMAAKPAITPRAEEIRRAPLETPTPVAAASGYSAPPSPTIAAPRNNNGVAPWVIGAGAGAVLIAVAVMVSRNFAPSVEPVAPPTVVGEAAKPSAEDAQLAAEPTAAGPVTEAPAPAAVAAATPAVTPEPTPAPAEPVVAAAKPTPAPVEEKRVIAAAPTTPPAPRVQAPAPSPALQPLPSQVTKTLTPTPEPQTLAQATPPVTLRDPTPATPPVVTPSQAQPLTTPPVATAPTPEQATMPNAPTALPPMAQATPQADPQAPAVNPEDTGITVKVRSALASDTVLSAVPIVVSTDHGVVKLEGQAPDPQARERATVVAAATQGVKGVDNRLTLPPVAQSQQLEPQQVARAQGS